MAALLVYMVIYILVLVQTLVAKLLVLVVDAWSRPITFDNLRLTDFFITALQNYYRKPNYLL